MCVLFILFRLAFFVIDMLYKPCHMLSETLVIVTFQTCLLRKFPYCALNIIDTFERTATIGSDTVYLYILVAKLDEVPTCYGSPFYCCHDAIMQTNEPNIQ